MIELLRWNSVQMLCNTYHLSAYYSVFSFNVFIWVSIKQNVRIYNFMNLVKIVLIEIPCSFNWNPIFILHSHNNLPFSKHRNFFITFILYNKLLIWIKQYEKNCIAKNSFKWHMKSVEKMSIAFFFFPSLE